MRRGSSPDTLKLVGSVDATARGATNYTISGLLREGVSEEQAASGFTFAFDVGGGYGVPTAGMVEALTMMARLEGILLDPVYSGKGMAGLIDLCRKGHFKKGENVVFLHTGGSVALYGYMDAFSGLKPL